MGFLSNIVNGIKNVAGGIRNAANTVSDWYSKYILGEDDSGTSTQTQAPSTTPAQAPSAAPTQTPTPTQTPSAAPTQAPSAAPTQAPSTVPTQAPSGTPGGTSGEPNGTSGSTVPSATPGTDAAPGKEYTSQYGKENGTSEDHIPTYEEFLKGNTAGYDHIRTETSAFYDEQAKKTLEALDEKKAAADDYASGQRDSVYRSLEDQTAEMYKYAENVLGESLGYNQQAYDAIVKLLGEELAAGKLNAEEAKELLLSLAGETRQGVYDTAERQREEAHKNADIYRERANVNAQNAYAQNLAGYGANAEVLGRMGITGGGYGDWVNGNAYATQRAEVQAANAEAEGAKREAIYTEDMLKLQADNEYNKQKGQAEFDYLERLYNLDSNYRTDMAEAEQTKAAADKAAEDTARDTKFKSDTLEREGKAEADLKYSDMLYQNEADYKADKLAAEQNRDAGKFQAEMDYVQNVMQNDERIAEYMRELQAGGEVAEERRQALFTELLAGANSGAYDAEELTTLANMFGFDETLTNQLVNSANGFKTSEDTQYRNQVFNELMTTASSGALDSEAIAAIASRAGLGETEISQITAAATRRSDKDTAAEDKATKDRQDQNILNMMAESGDAVGYIQTAIEKGALNKDDAGKYLMSSFKEDIKNGAVDVDAINSALDKKLIEPKDYEELKADYNKGIDTTDNSFKNTDGSLISKDDAVELISKAKEDKFISPDTIKALVNTYEKLYPDSGYIPVESNDITLEKLLNSTKNHIGTSSFSESTKDAVGKIFGK